MTGIRVRVLLAAVVGVSLFALQTLRNDIWAQTRRPSGNTSVAGDNETPVGSKWWPSKWGAEDQRGAANLMTPAKVLEATQLIKKGQVYQLGRIYQREMPTFPNRTFALTIPAFRSVQGENMQFGQDEFFVGEIGPLGYDRALVVFPPPRPRRSPCRS